MATSGHEAWKAGAPPAAAAPPADLAAQLADWHAQGGHRVEPVRFALVEAMARRAARHQGRAGALLDARLAELVADLRLRLAGRGLSTGANAALPTATQMTQTTPAAAIPAPRGALGQLADAMADPDAVVPPPPRTTGARMPARNPRSSQRQRANDPTAALAQPGLEVAPGLLPSAASAGPAAQSAPRDLASVQRFRGTWSRLSADERLRQTLAQVPPQAGPLNSLHLLHRALVGMQDISPDYLQHFVAHVDALLWLEQVHTASLGAPAGRPGARRKAAARSKRP